MSHTNAVRKGLSLLLFTPTHIETNSLDWQSFVINLNVSYANEKIKGKRNIESSIT